ncbi:MAG: ABC transporter permease, partial [bacterium]|nr:ABC transporter permease [bacterium]
MMGFVDAPLGQFLYATVEAVKIAIEALRANKARATLTTLGIIIGIVGVVTTMTAANGLARSFKESVSVLGSDVLYVSRTPWVHTGRFFDFRNRRHLNVEDADKLERRLERAVAVNPTLDTSRNVKFRSEILENVAIIGTTDRHVVVSTAVPEFGRFMTAFEVQYKKPVCVIGSTVRERLFGA